MIVSATRSDGPSVVDGEVFEPGAGAVDEPPLGGAKVCLLASVRTVSLQTPSMTSIGTFSSTTLSGTTVALADQVERLPIRDRSGHHQVLDAGIPVVGDHVCEVGEEDPL